eukprot:2678740-Rhodomonas_salina.2
MRFLVQHKRLPTRSDSNRRRVLELASTEGSTRRKEAASVSSLQLLTSGPRPREDSCFDTCMKRGFDARSERGAGGAGAEPRVACARG